MSERHAPGIEDFHSMVDHAAQALITRLRQENEQLRAENQKLQKAPASTDLDRAEQLIVERLQRYAARTARQPDQAGLLKADKVICIIRERFTFLRTGKVPTHERGKGERARVVDDGKE